MGLLDWFILSPNTLKTINEKSSTQKLSKEEQQAIDDLVLRYLPLGTHELLHWRSPSQAYVKHINWIKVGVLSTLFSIAMFLVGKNYDIFVALIFLVTYIVLLLYLFIRPTITDTRITNKGVYTRKIFFPWSVLEAFWFDKQFGFMRIHIKTKASMKQVIMVAEGINPTEVKMILNHYIAYIKTPPTYFVHTFLELVAKIFA